jgi:hypothetical protein
MLYVTHVIIDTIILNNYTNDAYIFDTYDTSIHIGEGESIGLDICITIIDTIILNNYTNDAYTYDTYTHTDIGEGEQGA